MVISEEGMERAKKLAREMIRINKIKEEEMKRLEEESRERSLQESMEMLGRVIRYAHDTVVESFVKPMNTAWNSFCEGFRK